MFTSYAGKGQRIAKLQPITTASPEVLSAKAHSVHTAAIEQIDRRSNSLAPASAQLTSKKIGILEAYGSKSRTPASVASGQSRTIATERDRPQILEKTLPDVQSVRSNKSVTLKDRLQR